MAVRMATVDDAAAIAAIHVAAWRETYRGLVPDAVLDGLSVEARTVEWRRRLGLPGGAAAVAVDGGVVGFGSCGPQRDPGLGTDGEIYTLYVLVRAQRRGWGRGLMAALAGALRAHGRQSASLWVAEANVPARRFYEALDGRLAGAKVQPGDGFALAEVAYAWDRLDGLAPRG